jgi:nitroreductase
MEVFDAVVNRRSIRIFKEKPVGYDILEKCVEAARLAPTAMNSQLCEYFIADEKNMVAEILDSVALWGGVPKPPAGWSPEKKPVAYIVVLINLELEKERGCGRNNAFLDIGIALENMALVALELGVGTCIMTGIDKKRIGEIIKAPEKYEVAAMLALGYPDEKIALEIADGSVKRWVDEQGVRHIPKRRLEDILHHNKFE